MKDSIILGLAEKIKNSSVRDVVFEYVNVIKSKDVEINALLELYSDADIEAQIVVAQTMVDAGQATPMTGVPIVIKDNICFDGHTASAGSKMLESYVATYDATVVKKLKEAGAVIVGRANMDEFAMGSSTENSAYKKTLNPIDVTRVPGGSSGGSAAVVAYGGVPVSLGSDTGGSIRQPASFTDTVGLKPTYGSVSRYGLIAMGSSLDVIGSFTKTVADSKIIFDIIRGQDKKDATTIIDIPKKEFRKKIGVPMSFINRDGVDAEIRANFEKVVAGLKSNGYDVIDIDIKNIEKSLAVYYILMPAEVSSNLARFEGVRYGKHVDAATPMQSMIDSRSAGLGPEPTRRSLLGAYVLSSGYYDAYYYKAVSVRDILKKEFAKVFADVDVILTPTSPVLPWKFGDKHDPLSMYLADIFTVPANIVGVPGISVPSGKSDSGLPFGVQGLAAWGQEEHLFTIGEDIERL